MTSPQHTQRYTRSASVRSTLRWPQPEQSCEVCAGFTAMERLLVPATPCHTLPHPGTPWHTRAPRGVMEALGEASVLNPLLDALLDALLDYLRLLEARAQRSFPTRPCRRLLVLVHRLLSCFPGLRALGEQRVAEPASRLPRLREPPVLAVGGRAAGGA